MESSANRYTDSRSNVGITIYLTPRDAAFLDQLARANGTKNFVYASEIVSTFLQEKRNPNIEPNVFQRMAVETAVVSCQQD